MTRVEILVIVVAIALLCPVTWLGVGSAHAAEAGSTLKTTAPLPVTDKKKTKTAKQVAKKCTDASAASRSGSTGKSKRAKKARKTVAKATGRRCEPQSLTYARQRSGIMSGRTGHENGPLTWFATERKMGRTCDEPVAGSVLILGSDSGHGMPTGHVAYVEDAVAVGPMTYRVVFSHTNYDRRCSLETKIEALFDRSNMRMDILSGAWKAWGCGLRVAGFIRG